MQHTFLLILLSTLSVSLVALVGLFILFVREKYLRAMMFVFVGFAAGVLLGNALLHLFQTSLFSFGYELSSKLLLMGFVSFFIIERFLYWHHCHKEDCDIHPFSYMLLIGNAIHSFMDGLIIAASYLSSIALGLATTLAIILHEVPQELGNFSVLVYAGIKRTRALIYNLGAQLTAVVGGLLGYYLFKVQYASQNFYEYLLPFAAGGFLYIAASDLIPRLHEERNVRLSLSWMILFLLGLGMITLV